jgi:hypothetical protein
VACWQSAFTWLPRYGSRSSPQHIGHIFGRIMARIDRRIGGVNTRNRMKRRCSTSIMHEQSQLWCLLGWGHVL